MKMLICSNGMPQAENAIRFIASTAAACGAEVTLLGIIEHPSDETALLDALRRGAGILRDRHVPVETITRSGHAIEEIQKRTTEERYDIVIIGAERKSGGPFAMSAKAYHLIKEIEPPVLVMIGRRAEPKRVLICSGGRSYIDRAVHLAGELACKTPMQVTILHVMAEAPAVYAELLERERDTERILASNTTLGRNLRAEKSALEAVGVQAAVKLRHGLVVDEILAELREGDYDMVVTGSAPAGGPLRTYIMGNVTSEIVNRADCAVLVVRGGGPEEAGSERAGLLGRLLRVLSGAAKGG